MNNECRMSKWPAPHRGESRRDEIFLAKQSIKSFKSRRDVIERLRWFCNGFKNSFPPRWSGGWLGFPSFYKFFAPLGQGQFQQLIPSVSVRPLGPFSPIKRIGIFDLREKGENLTREISVTPVLRNTVSSSLASRKIPV